jgi:hypothetical protein
MQENSHCGTFFRRSGSKGSESRVFKKADTKPVRLIIDELLFQHLKAKKNELQDISFVSATKSILPY